MTKQCHCYRLQNLIPVLVNCHRHLSPSRTVLHSPPKTCSCCKFLQSWLIHLCHALWPSHLQGCFFFLSNFSLFTFYFYCDFFNIPGILRKLNHLFISVPPILASLLEMLIQGFVYLEFILEIR